MIASKAAAVLKKDVLTSLRYRGGLLLGLFAPVAQLVTFFYLAKAIGQQFRPEGFSYFTFLVVGTGFYTFLLSGMQSFLRAIQESQQTGTLEALMTTSTAPAILLSLTAMSAFGAGLGQFLIYIAAEPVVLFSEIHVSFVAFAVTFLLSIAIAVAFGMFAAGVQMWMQKGSIVLWAVGSSAWILSGTLFPVGALPPAIRNLAQCLPLTHCLTAMRLSVLDSTSPLLIREIGLLACFAAILLPAGIAFFSWTVRRARQFGTLSFY